jgi:hypothetical protein
MVLQSEKGRVLRKLKQLTQTSWFMAVVGAQV